MASAGFELANLGTKGQHATPRPPQPHNKVYWTIFVRFEVSTVVLLRIQIFWDMMLCLWVSVSWHFLNDCLKCQKILTQQQQQHVTSKKTKIQLQVSESQPTVSTLKIYYLNPAHNRFSAHQTLLDAGGTYRAAGHMSTGLEQCVTLQIRAHQALI
jgi:hypothetical protein